MAVADTPCWIFPNPVLTCDPVAVSPSMLPVVNGPVTAIGFSIVASAAALACRDCPSTSASADALADAGAPLAEAFDRVSVLNAAGRFRLLESSANATPLHTTHAAASN